MLKESTNENNMYQTRDRARQPTHTHKCYQNRYSQEIDDTQGESGQHFHMNFGLVRGSGYNIK